MKTIFRLSPIALALAVYASGPHAFAQTQALEVLVTAPAVIDSNSTDDMAGFKTTVTSRQIEDLNAIDAAAALRRTPGVSISRFNPVGSFGGEEGGAVYIRGMGTSRPGSEIKTYIDGVPFYMGIWNHPLLDLLPLNGMSRIDVIKGPQLHEFGNTFGAIALSPKKARATDGVSGDVSVRAGSFGTVAEQVDVLGRQGDWDFSLAQGYASSDGHRPDAKGRLNNVMGQLGHQIDRHWSVRLLAMSTKNSATDPGHATTLANKGQIYDTQGELLALTVAHQHDTAQGSFKLYSTEGYGEQKPGLKSSFKTSGLRWRENLQPWQGGQVQVGLDVDKIGGDVATVGFIAPDLRVTSPFVAISHKFELGQGWTATPSAGLRRYEHNVLKSESAHQAGVVLAQGERLALRAQVSKGISYPGLDAAVLSHLIPALSNSWKSLGAERLDHQELGATWKPQQGTSVDVSVFKDRVKDRYIFAFPPAVSAPSFVNMGSYEVTGSELTWAQSLGQSWQWFAGWTHLNSSKADLPYAPENSLTAGVNWQQGAWRVSADVQHQSAMVVLGQARNGDPNLTQVPSFTVANLRMGYKLPQLGQRGEVFAAVENIFDKTYAFREGYPMPGRALQLGVKASF